MKGNIFAADEAVRDVKEAFLKIKEAILACPTAADKHRRPVAFEDDAWVLLKFSKARLRQRTGKERNGLPAGHQKYYAKLAKRYYGPFQILNRINETAYRLKLPSHWQIHNEFHVGLLRPYKGEPPLEPIHDDALDFDQEGEEILQPKLILKHEDKVL